MKNHNLAFTDIETTGLDAHKHEIIELGCIVVRQTPRITGESGVEIVEEFEFKIKPEHLDTADPEALKINGYNKHDWGSAIPLKEALEIFVEKTEGAALVAHNVIFDWVFLEEAFRKTGIKNRMHYHKLDTLSIAFARLYDDPKAQKFSLRALASYFGVRNEKAHSALSDTRTMFEIYKKLLKIE